MTRQRRAWAGIRKDLIQTDEDRVIYDETGIAIRLGERVRQARLDAGLTQVEVARRAGVHQQAVAASRAATSSRPSAPSSASPAPSASTSTSTSCPSKLPL